MEFFINKMSVFRHLCDFHNIFIEITRERDASSALLTTMLLLKRFAAGVQSKCVRYTNVIRDLCIHTKIYLWIALVHALDAPAAMQVHFHGSCSISLANDSMILCTPP